MEAAVTGMRMPISVEFVTLCRAQISLLTDGFGATLSVVYLTQELVEGAKTPLTAIAAYPDLYGEGTRAQRLLPPMPNSPVQSTAPIQSRDRSKQGTPPGLDRIPANPASRTISPQYSEPAVEWTENASFQDFGEYALTDQWQIVLPLIHEDMALGLLVTQRDDHAWQPWEQEQIEEIAKTLAIACVLDQRYQWLDQERQQERLLQIQQHDQVDNLLHQFRNSLTALQTFGKLLLKRLLPGDASREIATTLVRETTRLQDLSQQLEQVTGTGFGMQPRLTAAQDDTLVDLRHIPQTMAARLDTKPMPLLPAAGYLAGAPLALERCLVETVLEPLISAAGAIAEERQLALYHHIPEDLPPVWANPKALHEVLNNLIENALKYTPSGGQVWVTVFTNPDESQVDIAVSDTGPGIGDRDREHLFERHFRGVQAESDIPGSGLGLAIARDLIEQMHGAIQVFSPAQREALDHPGFSAMPATAIGTTFRVQLEAALGEGRGMERTRGEG